jgi:tellurite resistance protein TerC
MNPFRITYKVARRLAVTAVGSTILLLGIIMIVIPGPAVIVIPLGLAVLGIEFAWARTWLRRIQRSISANNAEARADRAQSHRRRHMDD